MKGEGMKELQAYFTSAEGSTKVRIHWCSIYDVYTCVYIVYTV